MPFSASMSIPEKALNYFKALVVNLKKNYPVKAGLLTRIYLHWAVAGRGSTFTDYNLMVLSDNNNFRIVVTGNPQDNVAGLNGNAIHSHTWNRNTNAIGIAIDGMDGATVNNFGPDALSESSLLYLCGAAAAVAKAYGIDTSGKVINGTNHLDNNGNNVNTTGENTIITHGEAAIIDAYSSERWDLGTLAPLPSGVGLTSEMRIASGNQLRALIHRIKLEL